MQLLKETALRSAEACNLQWKDIDFQRKIIMFNNPLKNGNPRIFKISNKLAGMLLSLPKKNKYVFATNSKITRQTVFYKARRRLAAKLGNPRLLRIGFHTFSHWKAIMEYHRTKDILHVKELLRHRNIENTMICINLEKLLFNNENDEEFHVKVAKNIDEACELIKVGFKYVTEYQSGKIFRKRK